MDPRFILHPTHVVDRSSARFLPPGTAFAGGHSPALLSSHLSPVQPFYTAYDQTLGVGEVAFSASVPSGQAYFRTDRLPPGTTVLQEVPNPEVGGVGYGLGPVNLGYRNVALTPLNNLQVAEIGPSAGVHSLIVPSYADVSGCGHGYGNSATVCVYQAYPQAQIHAGPALLPLSPLPSRQHMFLDQALDQEYGSLDQTNPPLRARRMEVDRIRKLERGRVLDQRRELQRKPDIQKASLKKGIDNVSRDVIPLVHVMHDEALSLDSIVLKIAHGYTPSSSYFNVYFKTVQQSFARLLSYARHCLFSGHAISI